jgi:hypothetical protein
MAEVARGNVPGASILGSYGELTTAGAVDHHLIWPNPGSPDIPVPPSSGVQMSIVSTSVNDTAGGTGTRTVHIHYLDGNLDPQNEEITLNGTTPVLTVATDVRFIQCMHMDTYGTLQEAAGTITASNGGITYSLIAQGDRRCSSSARRIPRGKMLYIHALWGGSSSGTAAASSTVRLVITYLEGHDYTEDGIGMPYASISVQDGSEALTLLSLFPVPEGSIVALEVTSDKAATISGGFAGYLENI